MASVTEEYTAKIIEDIIRKKLQSGIAPTIEEIEKELAAFLASNNVSQPLFDSNNYKVERSAESSASKYNQANDQIKQDMDIAFRALFKSTRQAVQLFNRWETKATKLENRIIGLEARINRLLNSVQDTAGYFNTVGDKFTDTTKIDLDLSKNININLQHNLVSLAKVSGSSSSVSRIFLNDLDPSQVRFNVLTAGSVIRVSDEQNTAPLYAFKDVNLFWKTNVYTQSRVSPMLAELNVSFIEPVQISKINLLLHSSQSNSLMRITPMYSTDGINYARLPISNTIAEVLDKAEFVFPELSVLKLKFILEKRGHDYIDSSGFYVYEFGAKEISLYKEVFSDDPNFVGLLISKPLNIRKPDGSNVLFNKVALEVCEVATDSTPINYFIAVAKDSNGTPSWLTSNGFTTDYIVNGTDIRIWSPVTPLNRTEIIHPQVLDFAVSAKQQKDNIGISYDRDGGVFVSPKKTFLLMQNDSAGSVKYEACINNATAANRRYFLVNSSHQLLDLQIDSNLDIDLEGITLWRNVGEKGIAPGTTTKKVRGVQIGWEYKEPYYYTNIYIENSDGISIDAGSNPITIDNNIYNGLIGPNILSQGIHSIRIHKDYWREVPPGLNTLAQLTVADPLYPYNQKLLIEGYFYGANWEDEKVYQGVDRFAGYIMSRVSIFDMLNNVPSNDYSKFAIDLDAPNTSTIDSTGEVAPLSRVFVVNADTSIADFMNEKFMLEFNLTSELYSYVALKAQMSTSNNQLTPVLDEYRIKLGT